jgi:hypothetical protein
MHSTKTFLCCSRLLITYTLQLARAHVQQFKKVQPNSVIPLAVSERFFLAHTGALGHFATSCQSTPYICRAMHLWLKLGALALLAQVAQSALLDTGGVYGFDDTVPLVRNNDVSSATFAHHSATLSERETER